MRIAVGVALIAAVSVCPGLHEPDDARHHRHHRPDLGSSELLLGSNRAQIHKLDSKIPACSGRRFRIIGESRNA